jgi:hypothetical protein
VRCTRPPGVYFSESGCALHAGTRAAARPSWCWQRRVWYVRLRAPPQIYEATPWFRLRGSFCSTLVARAACARWGRNCAISPQRCVGG